MNTLLNNAFAAVNEIITMEIDNKEALKYLQYLVQYNRNSYSELTCYWVIQKYYIKEELTKITNISLLITTQQELDNIKRIISEIEQTIKSADSIIYNIAHLRSIIFSISATTNEIISQYNTYISAARNNSKISKKDLPDMSKEDLAKLPNKYYSKARAICIELSKNLYALDTLCKPDNIFAKLLTLYDILNDTLKPQKHDELHEISDTLANSRSTFTKLLDAHNMLNKILKYMHHPETYGLDNILEIEKWTTEININMYIPISSEKAEQVLKYICKDLDISSDSLQPFLKLHDEPNMKMDTPEFKTPPELQPLVPEENYPKELQNSEATSSLYHDLLTTTFPCY